MSEGSVMIHDEPEYVNFAGSDPKKNLAAEIRIDIGDLEKGFEDADRIFEGDYEVPKVQQASIEPHVTITYWDEDDRSGDSHEHPGTIPRSADSCTCLRPADKTHQGY